MNDPGEKLANAGVQLANDGLSSSLGGQAMATQYVQVPVPSALVPAVLAYISDHLVQQEVAKDQSAAWTEKELRKLWNESADNIRRTLILLASNSGNPVSGETISREVLDKDDKGHSIAGMMGAFSRRMKGRHKGKNPIVAEHNAQAQEWQYSIPSPEVRQVILRLARV